ncbi:MAG: formamidopyrimidine-DNA glycosylase [Pirellulaceae bacterium]|jgi:formamidopyrimidine-DNA glycosylase
MPELPEVETMRRGILDIEGAKILDVHRLPCARKPIRCTPGIRAFRNRACGKKIVAVERIGKRVVVRLESDERIIFEPRMTGLVLAADPPSKEHLRFRVDLSCTAIPNIWYWDRRGLGSVRLMNPIEFATELGPDKLGPDALQITVEEIRDRLKASRRAIKVALLDQKVVAGVGNLYASELLHLAEVHPARRCDRITKKQWQRIHDAMLEVLKLAIKHEGSTLGDGTYRTALNDPGGYQNHHRVYDKKGDTCVTCGKSIIQRIVQTQRSTFFCPICQRNR